jgi:murein DD-endopeptidase MepM/ murein hydrolase activator NlpD
MRDARPDLGDEPALSLAGGRHALLDRKQISLRWLSGTLLTAVAGTGLMGGALLAAVDGETRLARDPSIAPTAAARQAAETPTARKGDRLPPRVAEQQTRRLVQIATATRVGDREIVRTRPFARVQANLALERTAVSASIPAFNPLRVFNEAGAPFRAPPPAARDLEGEMTVVTRGLADALGAYADDDRMPPDQVAALVRQTQSLEIATVQANASAPSLPSRSLTAADLVAAATTLGFGPADGGARIGGDAQFRIFQENVTEIEKTRPPGARAPASATDETTHIVQRGESLATILVSHGASLEESRTIIEALSRRVRAADIREGHRLRIVRVPSETDFNRRMIARVAVLRERSVLAVAVLTELGQFANIDMSLEALDEPLTAQAEEEEEAEQQQAEVVGATPTLYVSIYETALRNAVPRPLIDELIKIYSFDVDFQRRVRPGDSFEVFYAADEETGGTPTRDDVLYASLTVGGETRRYFRFRTDDDGLTDFFDEQGRSAKKFLMRTPVNGGLFRSGFGMRRHPILGYARMHTGVDWSAPSGTPIMAAGAGTVIKAEWSAGYGRRVEIQHANGYVTTYSHLSAFARNLARGTRVTQGQIVGFLGSSGLSTGPHLHYEILVNGSFVDPLRIRVPRGRTLDGRFLAEFERERLRIEQMMRRAEPTRVARVGS